MKKFILFFFMLSGLLFYPSCEKEEAQEVNFEPTLVNLNDFQSIGELQNNSIQAYSHIQQINAWMSMPQAYMNMPDNYEFISNNSSRLGGGDIYTFSWDYMGYSITYSYGLVGDQYTFNYTCYFNDVLYYEMDGWQNIDGSAGQWEYNSYLSALYEEMNIDFNQDMDYQGIFEWTYVNSVFTFNYSFDFMDFLYEVNGNISPTSGEYYWYLNNSLLYEASWDLSGGQYIMYGEKGEIIFEMSW